MKKTKQLPKVSRWISTPAEERNAARRIQATTRRNTPEARQRAAAYQREYRQRPGVAEKMAALNKASQARLKITWPGGIVPSYVGPRRFQPDLDPTTSQEVLPCDF